MANAYEHRGGQSLHPEEYRSVSSGALRCLVLATWALSLVHRLLCPCSFPFCGRHD